MRSVRYRLVTLDPNAILPVVEGVPGRAWFWTGSFRLPDGKTLDTLDPEDLPLRADPGTPPVKIGPVLVATGETGADAWRAALTAGKWLPEAREDEARELETTEVAA